MILASETSSIQRIFAFPGPRSTTPGVIDDASREAILTVTDGGMSLSG